MAVTGVSVHGACEQDQGHATFFFRSAQRFFIARPIRLRAAADRCRLRPSGLPDAVLPR